MVRAWATCPPAWLEIRAPARIDPNLGLGIGETHAISLARKLHADAVLIDERRALTIARKAGLVVTDTLGVLEIAAERILLDLVSALAALRQTTFRVSDQILGDLLRRDADRRRQLLGDSDGGDRK